MTRSSSLSSANSSICKPIQLAQKFNFDDQVVSKFEQTQNFKQIREFNKPPPPIVKKDSIKFKRGSQCSQNYTSNTQFQQQTSMRNHENQENILDGSNMSNIGDLSKINSTSSFQGQKSHLNFDHSDINEIQMIVQKQQQFNQTYSKLPPRVKTIQINKENTDSSNKIQLSQTQQQLQIRNQIQVKYKSNKKEQHDSNYIGLDANQNECLSARQSYQQLGIKPIRIPTKESIAINNKPGTPQNKGSDQKQTQGGIRSLLRESADSYQSNLMQQTLRSINPLDTNQCNTARTNKTRDEDILDIYSYERQKQSNKNDKIRRSCLKSTQTKIIQRGIYGTFDSTIKSRFPNRVLISDDIQVFEDIQSILHNTEDQETDSRDEIERNYRKYFKSEQDSSGIKDQEPKDSVNQFDPEVFNMKDSEYWKVVFDRLNIKYRNLWDLPLSKIDILIEKEFSDYRKNMIQEEDLSIESEKVVHHLEGLQKQNEDLQKEIEFLKQREKTIKRVLKPVKEEIVFEDVQLEYQINANFEHSNILPERNSSYQQQKQYQPANTKEDFEDVWNKLQGNQILHRICEPILEASFAQEVTQNSIQNKNFSCWEDSTSRLKENTQDATFMEVNDSFYQAIVSSDKQQQKDFDKPQVSIYKEEKYERSYYDKNNFREESFSIRDKKFNDTLTKTSSGQKPNQANKESEKKQVLTKHIRDFESQYAKYEEKLKLIEAELQDYNQKSKQLELDNDSSPHNARKPSYKYEEQKKQQPSMSSQKKNNLRLEIPDDLFMQTADIGSPTNIQSPTNNKIYLSNESAHKQQETPQFNKVAGGALKNKLNQIFS